MRPALLPRVHGILALVEIGHFTRIINTALPSPSCTHVIDRANLTRIGFKRFSVIGVTAPYCAASQLFR